MNQSEFIPSGYPGNLPEEGEVAWSAPSNIALVKYWGKYENQIPANPSISLTLSEAVTKTRVEYRKRRSGNARFEFLFEGKPKPSFLPKMEQFFERIGVYMPFLDSFEFVIHSENSFPHSSGIASSASSMSALSLCLMSMESALSPEMSPSYFHTKASFLARLGSGSACRSIWGPVVTWGEHKEIPGSSDLYGSPYGFEIDPVFTTYRDTILLVDEGSKAVSSTMGHKLMEGHPYASARFQQAHDQLSDLRPVLASGDLEGFMHITEREALTLHAMMMTSSPYFILMKPNTLKLIEHIWEFRRETGIPVCFTLDAGANVHLLYPEAFAGKVDAWVAGVLSAYCQGGRYICDQVGTGAKKIELG